MKRFSFKRPLLALMIALFVACQGTWALAGTTGGLQGQVTDDKGSPVAAADIKVTSASQTASTKTDASGHFTFLSLAPDTYTVAIDKDGYNPISYAGVSVFADNQLALSFRMTKAIKEIARVVSRSSGALVKAGTTSDVYSVNSATAAKLTGLGGGGGLDSAYSAIASVPGAYVPVGQNGWFQTVIIRGGNFDQVGYEVDGVPVNRSFDNYPSSTASALGQQEVQVYTGASPANAESQGLAGFLNQVVKTGTYPGFLTSDLGVGAPTFYHKANIEVGGATPDRMFSYYAGFGGYNQSYRLYDNNNGAAVSDLWGPPLDILKAPASCTSQAGLSNDNCYALTGAVNYGPGGLINGPFQYASTANISDRESVVNFHFGIPHHHDGGRDDLQLLYQNSDLVTAFYNAESDIPQSLQNFVTANGTNGITNPIFFSGYQYNGALGQPLVADATGHVQNIVTYNYPSRPYDGNGGPIPATMRDTNDNGIGIVKLQYQKNFGSDAYLRVYGYTLYSNWFLWGPQTTFQNFVGPNPADYELESHTRGLSATFAKQLNPHNLLQLQGSYTTATVVRDNNTQMTNGFSSRSLPFGIVVAANSPTNGICYNIAGGVGVPTSCLDTRNNRGAGLNFGNSPTYIRLDKAANGTTLASLTGTSCGGGPCEWLATENGARSTYNSLTPKFASASITDEWDPSDRVHVNLGLRYDRFQYDPGSTTGPARAFWFNAWNSAMCYDTNTIGAKPVEKVNPTLGCTAANLQGTTIDPTHTYAAATLRNVDDNIAFSVVQPRVGVTFTVNPRNVLRFSYGKYDQAPNTAYIQYNTGQQDLATFLGTRMFAFGRTQPTYPVRPQISYNTDLSWEHQFNGTDITFKLTPFYRSTRDQIQQFFLDEKTGFVSGLNTGNQISDGVEFQLQKGDFSRNGLAALLSYTYTDAKVKYSDLGNGSSVLDPINQGIQGYNSFTSSCASNPNDSRCGGAAIVAKHAAPCYGAGGAPISNSALCVAGTVANPYWNAPLQGMMAKGSYPPYNILPGDVGAGSYSSIVAPHVATLVLNYKHDKFAITPAVQYSAGIKYGYPLANFGVDPTSCGALTAAPDTARYPYGAAGGSGYDAQSCTATTYIPNPDTGTFDTMGAFVSPTRLTGNVQLSYEFTSRVTAVATLSNVFDTCWGGTKGAWTSPAGVPSSKVCGYTNSGVGSAIAPVGNIYNPGATIQPAVAHAYAPLFGSLPFNAYVDLKIKL